MTSCTNCSINLYEAIQRFRLNEEASIEFFRHHGVLPSSVECPRCHSPCLLYAKRKVWRCRKTVARQKRGKAECGFNVSDRKNTFLENARLPAWKVLLFVNHFLDQSWSQRIMFENLEMNYRTSVDWTSCCSEVCQFWLEHVQEKLGGPGVEVEIDENIISCRKDDEGRQMKTVWLFGGIERISKKTFLVPLTADCEEGDSRDAATLIPLIFRHIRPGSIIYSDCWSACVQIPDPKYTHHQINHTEHFVDTEHQNIHTQTVERLWRILKEIHIRSGIKTVYLRQYVARVLFLKSIPQHSQRLHRFLTEMTQLYPGPN